MIVVEIYLTTVKPLLSEHEETSLFIDLDSQKIKYLMPQRSTAVSTGIDFK